MAGFEKEKGGKLIIKQSPPYLILYWLRAVKQVICPGCQNWQHHPALLQQHRYLVTREPSVKETA